MSKKLAAFILFLLAIGTGYSYHQMKSYAGTAGESGEAQLKWPEVSKLIPADQQLIMFVHPGCPCSAASLKELQKLTSKDLNTIVVVMSSPELEHLIKEGPIVNTLKKMKDVKMVFDKDGSEAKLFGAKTSGATYLYENKNLLYSGGLTPARGHEGNSLGLQALKKKLNHESTSSWNFLVYGCGLFKKVL